MLFPIGDDDRKLTGTAYVTMTLIAANLAVFFLGQGAGMNLDFTYGWSVIPLEIITGQDLVGSQTVVVEGAQFEVPQAPGPPVIYLTILSAMFMHGGFMHLFGNLLYLWIFGDNVEHRFGAKTFLAFYLASGIAATAVQVWLDPNSVIPNLGASGAISGVLGAYLVLFPRNKVYAIFLFTVVSIPAVFAIGLWIVMQVISGWGDLVGPGAGTGGVAYGAHIGGFVAGVALAFILRAIIKEEKPNVFTPYMKADRARRYW